SVGPRAALAADGLVVRDDRVDQVQVRAFGLADQGAEADGDAAAHAVATLVAAAARAADRLVAGDRAIGERGGRAIVRVIDAAADADAGRHAAQLGVDAGTALAGEGAVVGD